MFHIRLKLIRLIITKHQNHDPLVWQLLVLVLYISVCCHLSSLSYSAFQLRSVLLSLLFTLIFFVFLNAFPSVPGTIDLPLFSSVSLSLMHCFSLSYMLFLITSGRVTSPLPSNQFHWLTSKQLHFCLTDMHALKFPWLTSLPWAQNIFIKTESSSQFAPNSN